MEGSPSRKTCMSPSARREGSAHALTPPADRQNHHKGALHPLWAQELDVSDI